jgi:tRNA pseudouridine38-40 synthase
MLPACENIKLKAVVRYDGTPFGGWQVQPDRRTVQGDIEAALSRIASRPIRVQGAGRTDAGVHALGQVCSFTWPADAMPHERLRRSLSAMLGPAVRIESVAPVPDTFDARHSAVSKRYAYTFDFVQEPDPISARYAWCVRYRVDLELLTEAARPLLGEHDFAGYQSSGAEAASTRRCIYSIELHRGGVFGPCDGNRLWRLEFHGNAFLYKMVRNITGSLVEVARGKLPKEWIVQQLQAGAPFRGRCAPAHGLALIEVLY